MNTKNLLSKQQARASSYWKMRTMFYPFTEETFKPWLWLVPTQMLHRLCLVTTQVRIATVIHCGCPQLDLTARWSIGICFYQYRLMKTNCAGVPCQYITPLQGLQSYVNVILYEPGCSDTLCPDASLVGSGATSADAVVIVAGIDHWNKKLWIELLFFYQGSNSSWLRRLQILPKVL